jgi:hypothetical protein
MRRALRRRFWVESVAAVFSMVVFVLTLLRRDWIEVVFGVDPDRGSGALEWLIVVTSVVVTVALMAAARYEWRRAAASRA